MKVDNRTIVASSLLLFITLLLIVSTSSKNQITAGDCNATIEVRVAFYGAGANDILIANWETAIERFWNGAAGHQRYGDCECRLRFDLKARKVANMTACPIGYHCVEIKAVPPHGVHRSQVSANWGGPGFSKAPYNEDATGDFASNDDAFTVAHEFGHLLGLDDDYFDAAMNFSVDATGAITFKNISIPARFNLSDGPAVREVLKKAIKKAGIRAGNWSWNPSLRKPGVDNRSIMAMEAGIAWIPLPGHIKQVAGGMALACAAKCCCGNGKLEKDKGEECDRNMTANCTGQDPYCGEDCKCKRHYHTIERTTTQPENAGSSSSTTTTTTTTSSSTTTTTTTTSTSRTSAAATSSSTTTTTIVCGGGTYKRRADCESNCDLKHSECKLNAEGCYYCSENCAGDTFTQKTYCDVGCDLDHGKCLINEDGCYECTETCPQPKYATSAACSSACDSLHSRCNVGTDGCYSCTEVCPGNTYRTSACGGKCAENELCTANLETGCYSCIPIDCGEYCSSQGGYAAAGENVASATVCQSSYLQPRMTSKNCQTTCGFVKFKTYANGYRCCCIKVFWLPCQNCPCQQPCEPTCPDQEDCSAAEPSHGNEG